MSSLSRRQLLKTGLAGGLALATPHVARAQTTLKVVWMGWPDNQVLPLMAEFEKRNPAIKLAVERMPFTQIFQALEVRLNGRTSDPDIYIVDSPLTASYAARGHLMELDALIDKSRFAPAGIGAASYQGKIYSAPFGSSMQVLYFNRSLFERRRRRAAVGRRREALDLGAGGRGRKEDRETGGEPVGLHLRTAGAPLPAAAARPVARRRGAVAGRPQGERVHRRSGLRRGLRLHAEALHRGEDLAAGAVRHGADARAVRLRQMRDAARRNVHLRHAQEQVPEPRFRGRAAPYFAKGKPVTPTGAWHFGVNPRSTQKEAVAQFVRDMLSDDMNVLWFKLRPYVPTLNAVWQKENATFSSDMWKIAQSEMQNTALARPATPGFREYEDILRVTLRDMQSGGNVKDMLTAAAQKIDREIAKYKG